MLVSGYKIPTNHYYQARLPMQRQVVGFVGRKLSSEEVADIQKMLEDVAVDPEERRFSQERCGRIKKELNSYEKKQIRLTLDNLDANLQDDLKEKGLSQERCGTVKLKNLSGHKESLEVYKAPYGKSLVYLVRKPDNDTKNTLMGYVSYNINNNNKIKDLYDIQNDNFSYIKDEFMLSAGQENYKGLGNKLHQLLIESSILAGCPGRVLFESVEHLAGLSPAGFHYKNGFVPYIEKDDKYVINTEKDDKIIKHIEKNKGYTPEQNLDMYLHPDYFMCWLDRIKENPILDEMKNNSKLLEEARQKMIK